MLRKLNATIEKRSPKFAMCNDPDQWVRVADRIVPTGTSHPAICPLRVISGQTIAGPKYSFVRSCPIADKQECGWNVRFVPIATDAPQQTVSLFDHLGRAGKQRVRHGEAERLGGLEIDDQLELGRR